MGTSYVSTLCCISSDTEDHAKELFPCCYLVVLCSILVIESNPYCLGHRTGDCFHFNQLTLRFEGIDGNIADRLNPLEWDHRLSLDGDPDSLYLRGSTNKDRIGNLCPIV